MRGIAPHTPGALEACIISQRHHGFFGTIKYNSGKYYIVKQAPGFSKEARSVFIEITWQEI